MPNVFVLIEEDGARKSSTIRALTGIHNKGDWQVATTTVIMNIYIETRSLQEKSIRPQDFINQFGNKQNILISLRINPCKGCPGGVDYINAFVSNGWNISQIVILGTNILPGLSQGLPQPFPIPIVPIEPANQIASRIRTRWGWF